MEKPAHPIIHNSNVFNNQILHEAKKLNEEVVQTLPGLTPGLGGIESALIMNSGARIVSTASDRLWKFLAHPFTTGISLCYIPSLFSVC